jgi:hypothetical protein
MLDRFVATRPPGSVIPWLLPTGMLLCPKCKGECRTPTMLNPNTHRVEPMILLGGKIARCPHAGCDAVHFFPEELARLYNRRLYPEDLAFWSPIEN